MTDESIQRMIAEAASNGVDDAYTRMMAVQSAAWEGIKRAVDRGEDQLTNAELMRPLSDSLIEVMTTRGMSAGDILSVFQEVCAEWDK